MKRILFLTLISFVALIGPAYAGVDADVSVDDTSADDNTVSIEDNQADVDADADVSTGNVASNNNVAVAAPVTVSNNRVLTSESQDDHSVNDSYNQDNDTLYDNSTRTNVQDSFNEDNSVRVTGDRNDVLVDHSGRSHNFDLQGTGSSRASTFTQPARTITLPHVISDGKDYGVASSTTSKGLPLTGGVDHFALKLWGGIGMVLVGAGLELAGRRGPAISSV